jgi:nucleotide-binding universal stress UspA family protein
MRVLLAIDGSPYSQAVVDEAARRPWPPDTEMEILSVAHAFPAIPDPAFAGLAGHIESLQHEREKSHAAVDAAEECLHEKRPEIPVATEVLDGSPTKRILEEAERWGADLILLGSHGRGGLTRLIMGSVSHAVMLHAHCSVEVVRPPRATAAA